ncbi:hypothetical protein BCR42DRAFT_425794 [Absidia repens]|uniref:Uncharacterized protein n=1 Tax=Absidia repens TaxID=90262 RepID=A0A1X2I1X2_9FUNG|nr:hypothetical protein BCR42DRAFT_425794 [Absidia repens]
MQGHQRRQRRDEQQLSHMEKQLHHLRNYAAQRLEKKAMREKQYHEVYHMPVINTQYKKKYMRARDKNDMAEQQLSELHHAMDLVKDRLKHHQQQWTQGLDHQQSLTEQRQKLSSQLDHQQQLMAKLKQAQSFWCQFDTYHIQPCLELLQQWRYTNDHTGSDEDDQWTRLRLISVDYEETQLYGQQHWGHASWDVAFECTHCHATCESWPYLDKVRITQLLCASCYQDTRTSMIIEKKLYSILPGNHSGGAAGINDSHVSRPNSDKLRLSALSTSSSASIPSLISSTSKSTHSIINDCKPFVKKMKSALAMNQQKLDPGMPHNALFVPKYSH